MKKMLVLLLFSCSILSAQDDFVRGIMLFDDVNSDFTQMKDSLYLNWVQAAAETWGDVKNLNVVQNSAGLNVMGVERETLVKSSGQRMVFQAEAISSPNLFWNYFSNRIGIPEDTLFRSAGSAGYMVQNPVPDNEYRYGRTHYYVSFILKRTPAASGNPPVVRLEIWCKNNNSVLDSITLYNNDFSSSNLETKVREFTFSSPPTPKLKPQGVLLGKPMTSTSSGGCLVNNEYRVDIRVYWYGNVTTWLDKVIVEDDIGKNLFTGACDNSIRDSVLHFKNNYPLMKRFYLNDEPYISAFLGYNYVQNKIIQTYASDTTNNRGFSTTAMVGGTLHRFVIDAQPKKEIMVDLYPVTTEVPTPSMTNTEANAVGIASYTTDADYTTKFQTAVQWGYAHFVAGSQYWASSQNPKKPLWIIPQLHGTYFENTGKFQKPSNPSEKMQRPPTGNEITMMCNLAIAYGAKGIIPFIFQTVGPIPWGDEGNSYFDGVVNRDASPDGLFRNHWGDYITYPASGGTKTIKAIIEKSGMLLQR